MWRLNCAPGIGDLENISDEDEVNQAIYNNHCTNDGQSLYNSKGDKKVIVPVLSRLESLTDKDRIPCCRSYEAKRTPTLEWAANNLEDLLPGHVIETCGAHDREHDLIQSVSSTKHLGESFDDSISDEENGVLSRSSSNPRAVETQMKSSLDLKAEDKYEACTRSSIVEKIHDLATVPKKVGNNPFTSEAFEADKIHTAGNEGKEILMSFFGHENVEHSYEDDPIEAELLGNTQKGGDELFIKVASHGQRSAVNSMTELLENLQQQDEPSLGNSSLLLRNTRGKNHSTPSFVKKRTLPHLGNRNLENEEDHLEYSGGEVVSEDEDNNQNQYSTAIQKIAAQTMTDLLQAAFSHSEETGPTILKIKNSGIGYNGRLQQVLQNEKVRNLEFTKYLQTGARLLKNAPPDFSGSLVVQILSRYLEAKLTVCQCLFVEQTNDVNQFIDNAEKKKMIIFSSKICDNVELDVGKFVCIYPPWKEVQASNDENIILCMYFCQEQLNY